MVKAAKSTAIVGIGNPLAGDDGVGVVAAEALEASLKAHNSACAMSSSDVHICHVYGMAMLPLFEQYDKLIFLDAVDNTGEPAGTIVKFVPEDAAQHSTFKGAHDTTLADIAAAAKLVGYEFECFCYGIQISTVNRSQVEQKLSKSVADAIPKLLKIILEIV